ncbi:MAG: hypothetical protein ACK5Q5_13120 [Planctomycetaceae bacterium]
MNAPKPGNPFFRAVIILGAIFVVTVLSMLAATFGDPQAPPNRFFNAYGLPLIAVETVLLLVISFIALAVDRRQTLTDLAKTKHLGERDTDEGPPG